MTKSFVSVVATMTLVLASFVVAAAPASAAAGDATVDIWHGVGDPFGTTGTPQRFANVIGQVSDPVETQFGFHVIRRQEVQIIPKVSAKHILVMYAGSMRAPASISRSKEEAATRIQECLARHEKGEKFEDLAREYSDGPSGPNGGDLGEFPQGVMAPAFEQAAFACEIGKTTDVVETPFGYHIIYRYK